MPYCLCGEEMIIDKHKRFIFVHNPRTGGTSIRKALEKYQDQKAYDNVIDKLKETNFNNIIFSHHSHCNIEMVENSNEYNYVFTCVRNPFSRTYSWYKKAIFIGKEIEDIIARQGYHHLPSFTDYINEMYTYLNSPNTDHHYMLFHTYPYNFWTYNVPNVIRFEDLSNEDVWNELMKKCGFDEKINRPHENPSATQFEYREHYNDDTRYKLYEMFKDEIEKYGYNF